MSSQMPPDDPQDTTRVIGAQADAPAPGTPADGGATPSEAGLLPVGSRLAEFELTRVVGQGGFGVVYEAWDTDLERVVAIKEYLPVSLSTRQTSGTVAPLSERTRETFDLGMRSFINEARLLAQFDHPSLLKVLRFWQEKGTAYMAMPFYRGETLRQALNARGSAGVPEDWLMDILDGVTQALAVMHAANCYHRDIAPDNIILLEDSGRPVLLDFGAARRVITDKTQAITVILKPGYAPIEQYAEMPDMVQGAWTDVYALAAVMHVAVTGRAPPPSVARMLNDSYVPLASDDTLRTRYSARLLSAIDAGLGVRPEQRPQSMAELRGLLGLSGGGAPPASRRMVDEGDERTVIVPAGSASSHSMPAGTGRPSGGGARIGIAAAVVLALAGGGGWWWMQQQKATSPTATDDNVAAQSGPSPAASPTPPVPAAPTPAPAVSAATPSAPAPAAPPSTVAQPTTNPVPPPPAPAAAKAVTPVESLRLLARGATPGFDVVAKPSKAEVSIGKDALGFEVRSNRAGFVYVYLLTSGNEMFMLFPNQLDKYNKIAPGAPISLPRASWPMNSGGPPGANEFAVLVSEHERDFSGAGVQDGNNIFQQFSLPAVAALEASRGTGPAPLLGRVVCAPDTPCRDAYGVGYFRIVEK
ncbi:serine/threonine-protein kinase [Variovorax dokdonensis]|uniref:non-specific serine/threonine protein kinase n=1 Tax=Variovorax dokdonensis TaxID=344883 RepID=A0ABT7NAI1_9BURK|nr:serine/threonine-protein kinase [Variovorax dokdonensis]MDM0044948.1 serine/threonine-protein kinase [Variovorax dokdonensis]